MKAVLFAGLMYRDKSVFERVLKLLEEGFGEVDKISEAYDFTFTDYYENEMGGWP